ncbi:hypothetical protein FHX71_001353 [Promicromonospora sukumoe]|uniref:Uncharacterized protein n=1 Tax=Promicromonospora sukumoe TaxID=88382 RepID=A0A7W3J6W5_9MICO|nr:hypothetical protein [Promicromonospora sukumoe]
MSRPADAAQIRPREARDRDGSTASPAVTAAHRAREDGSI